MGNYYRRDREVDRFRWVKDWLVPAIAVNGVHHDLALQLHFISAPIHQEPGCDQSAP